jgi:exosortase/archaeosortase family protein
MTTHVGLASTELLNTIGSLSGYESLRELKSESSDGSVISEEISQIYHNEKRILYVEDGCNGLELIVLYIGFIICMPSNIWRKILFIIAGVIILHWANIIRSSILIYIREYHESYFDFTHTYFFKIVLYAITFALWMLFARKIKIFDETSKD